MGTARCPRAPGPRIAALLSRWHECVLRVSNPVGLVWSPGHRIFSEPPGDPDPHQLWGSTELQLVLPNQVWFQFSHLPAGGPRGL